MSYAKKVVKPIEQATKPLLKYPKNESVVQELKFAKELR